MNTCAADDPGPHWYMTATKGVTSFFIAFFKTWHHASGVRA